MLEEMPCQKSRLEEENAKSESGISLIIKSAITEINKSKRT